MGWKNIKDHYRIGHSVCVTSAGICIGSPYIHDLIVIGLDGTLKKRHREGSNDELDRYMADFDADPALLKKLVKEPDRFTKNITVYTFSHGEVIEKKCEETGWPHATHDGQMMYENSHSTNRAAAVRWAKEDATAGLKWAREALEEAEAKLRERRERVSKAEEIAAKAAAL